MIILYILVSLSLIVPIEGFQTYFTAGETRKWDLQKLFNGVDDPEYDVNDMAFSFGIQNPISDFGAPRNHIQAAKKIIATKPMVSRIGHYWLNHFLFLDLDGWNINLYYSESAQDENQATPYFAEKIKLVEQEQLQEEELVRCFDGDYISDKYFIIDCQKKVPPTEFQDMFFIVNKDGTMATFAQLTTKTKYDEKRILRMYETETTHYAFRGVTGQESIISSFEIVKNEPTYGKVNLNSILLQQLFNLDNTFKFEMVDFQVNYQGHVYILDKTALFVCQFNQNGEWSKINMYKFMTYTPYGFDLNEVITDDGQKLNILAILFNKSFNVYINTDTDGKRYQIPITITEQPASIQISMNFIVVQYSKTNYLYSIDSTNLLFKLTQDDGTQYLCNPHYPDYISISNIRSNRYLLSNGLLRYLESAKPVSQQNALITAHSLSDPTKKYEINMPYSIIETTDEALKQTNEWQVFTEPISQKDQTQLIQPFVSGPNIQYVNLDDKSGIDVSFRTVVQLTLPQAWPNPSDIVFQDMLQFDESRNYLIFQLKNLEIQFWECRIGKSTLLDDCLLDKKITTIKVQLDKYHFQWWIRSNAVHIAYCDTETTFQVWKLVGSDISMEVKVIFGTPITQILHLQEQLYVLQKEAFLKVYQATGEFQLIENIDDVYVKKLGFKKSWSPLKIWGNPKFMSHLIFIRNTNNILLIKFTNELVLVESIDVNTNYEAEITIYTKSFFLIKPNEIKEYNFQDLSDIYVMKVVPLYGFQLSTPLTFTQSDENGLLFISAKITEKQFIVVYQPDTLSHDSQLRLIDEKTLPKQLSACGFQHTYFYFNDGLSHQYSVVYRQVELTANANIKSDVYYLEVSKSLQIKNQLSVFNFKDLVGVVNTMSQIYTDDQYVPKQIEVEKKATVQQLSLGNTWYHGQVIDFKITCDQCPRQIDILNPINQINKNSFSKYNVKDVDNYDDLNQVFQLTDSIILVDQDNIIRAEIKYDQPNSCELIQSHPSQNLILSICQYNNIYHAYLVTCTAKFKCNTVDKPIDLLNLQSVTKFRFLDDNIILLSSLGNIYVYYLTYSKDTWTIKLQNTIELGLNDFDISPFTEDQKNYYLISIVDKSDNIVFMNAQVINQEFKEISTSSMPLYELIKVEKQFSFKTTDYIFVQSLSKITVDPQGLLRITLLIITNDVAHYEIQFILTKDKLVQKHTITNIFNQYSNWKTVSKFAYHNDKFAIAYTDGENYLGAVYQLSKKVSVTGVPTQTFLGGIKGKFNKKLGPLVLYLFDRLQQTILYSNLQSATDKLDIQTYQVYDSPQIAFIDGLNLNYQQILSIQAENDLTNATITTTLKEIIDNVIEKKSSNLWWILLLTFFLLAVAAALGWFVWKRKKQRDLQERKDFSLLNMQNDV